MASNGVFAGATSPAANIAGLKRKRNSKPSNKFYAVRIGKSPGIYNSWPDCLDQVKGFPKAVFKSFTTRTDAEHFVTGSETSGGGPSNPAKWYGVQSGRNPGVTSTWQDVLEQTTGVKNHKYKAFKTRAEAEQFVQATAVNADVDAIETANTPPSKKAKLTKAKATRDDVSAAQAIHLADYTPGEAPLPEGTEDGFDSSIILDETSGTPRYRTDEERAKMKVQVVRPATDSAIKIYTDGSSLGNGQLGAVGGVGVFFGPGDKRNLSEGLTGTRQTNQRAELTAILRALELAPRDRKVIIYSDSNYAINCVTVWFQKWRSNSWQNAAGKPVENKDLVQKILDVLEERYRMNKHRVVDEDDEIIDSSKDSGRWEKGPASVKFVWVKGHDKNQGNNAADQLAVAGAREARALN